MFVDEGIEASLQLSMRASWDACQSHVCITSVVKADQSTLIDAAEVLMEY